MGEALLAIFAGIGLSICLLVAAAWLTGIVEEIRYRRWLRRYRRRLWQEQFRRVQHPNCRCVVVPIKRPEA